MTAHEQAAAFIADIIANPADDAVRLIFADWLEENGDEDRASFIRVQHEPCRRGKHYTCDDLGVPIGNRCPRCHRERELLLHASYSWSAGLPLMPWHEGDNEPAQLYSLLSHFSIVFQRGFIAKIGCKAADWLTHADALTACQPIEQVKLTTCPDMNCATERPDKGYVGYSFRDKRLSNTFVDCEGSDRGNIRKEAALKALRTAWPRIKFSLPQTTSG